MTKYILNSGGVQNNPDLAKKFFAEIVQGLGNTPRFLFCFFAQPREDWERKFAEYICRISPCFPKGVTPTFELASSKTLVQQIQRSDVVYLPGGDDHLLQYWLRQFDIPTIWLGKVIATSSASSDALSAHFWTCDWRLPMNGLGILPIKFFPHFKSRYGDDDPRGPIDWQKGYEELQQYGDPSLPIHALEEGNYVIIEQ